MYLNVYIGLHLIQYLHDIKLTFAIRVTISREKQYMRQGKKGWRGKGVTGEGGGKE